ncbi:Oidioi.mRNA.OKI2018_I69.PAR.g13191.t1.cds [Oikopleura dioica]|uniref:Oidioi.mRNA.OKI2018_I69.PAR.g13191.t1.cds n=1 Tax=Oikopleura dioica TaxID=34765 RepID=A0ABN7S3P0_OIKDI|nr:Oidioi.mRNA.OKI2018_I69.PAR.g13191.t1.cds [Oikopleura dioica]
MKFFAIFALFLIAIKAQDDREYEIDEAYNDVVDFEEDFMIDDIEDDEYDDTYEEYENDVEISDYSFVDDGDYDDEDYQEYYNTNDVPIYDYDEQIYDPIVDFIDGDSRYPFPDEINLEPTGENKIHGGKRFAYKGTRNDGVFKYVNSGGSRLLFYPKTKKWALHDSETKLWAKDISDDICAIDLHLRGNPFAFGTACSGPQSTTVAPAEAEARVQENTKTASSTGQMNVFTIFIPSILAALFFLS